MGAYKIGGLPCAIVQPRNPESNLRPVQIGNIPLRNNLIVAPMAGVTDRPFRQLCKRLGAGMAVSEMVASDSRLWATEKSLRRGDHTGEVDPVVVQIAGAAPEMMAEAARYNVDKGAHMIDINMGCPAKKVCKVDAGSALMKDERQVARILEAKQPAAFLLENVKNLQSHDQGRTFSVIIQTLREELGYNVWYRTIDAQHFVPQHRERTVIVGFRDDVDFSWDDLRLPLKGSVKLGSILHPADGSEQPEAPFTQGPDGAVNEKYTLTDNLWQYLQDYAKKHQAKGNGFGFGLVGPDNVARTLSARYYKDGSEILIDQGNGKSPRRLTPRECARLMGYPDDFQIPVSDTQAYKQFGNSVAVPVFREVARIMEPHIQTVVGGMRHLEAA